MHLQRPVGHTLEEPISFRKISFVCLIACQENTKSDCLCMCMCGGPSLPPFLPSSRLSPSSLPALDWGLFSPLSRLLPAFLPAASRHSIAPPPVFSPSSHPPSHLLLALLRSCHISSLLRVADLGYKLYTNRCIIIGPAGVASDGAGYFLLAPCLRQVRA